MLPEFRKDPLSGRWVIVAPGRATRPQDVEAAASGASVSRPCPFCPGGEADTPDEVLAVRDAGLRANGPGWRVRVVPNKYPAVVDAESLMEARRVSEGTLRDDVESSLAGASGFPMREGAGYGTRSVPTTLPGRGVHEVIVESPRHLHSNTEQTPAELRKVLWAYRERIRALAAAGSWRYGLIFKNVGFAAGASLEHLHSQLVALPIVPAAIEETLRATAEFHHAHGKCFYCDLLQRELAAGTRIVAEADAFVALCPFAGRFAYETWIIPKRHAAHFGGVLDTELPGLTAMLHTVLRKLETALDRPAYNFAIRTAPFDSQADENYHWHVEIFPRITRLAGFELSTDFYINTVTPEDSARILRDA